MSKIIKRTAAIGAAVAIGAGALAFSAPTADAATYRKPGSVTVKEGRKVVREADKQKCLTLKEVRKIVKGAGYVATDEDNGGTTNVWYGKGKAAGLVVEGYDTGKCATAAALIYDNGNAYAWLDGRVLWA